MATAINLPLYNIEDDSIYINGKKITDNMTLRIKKLATEKYNIDFLIQFGNAISYNTTDITVDNMNSVLTSLPGEFGEDRKLGKHKLLQIVKVGDIESFTIKFTGAVTYTVNVELVSMEDMDVYLPNLKTTDNISFFPNGAAEYPVSNFDIPLPIVSDQYKIGWTINNAAGELPAEGLIVNLYYNTELFNITNLGDNTETRSINDLSLELDNSVIDLNNITVPSFTTSLVFEFVNDEGVILSTRSITLVRINLYLVDEFDRIISTFYLPKNSDVNLNKDFTYSSKLPDTNNLETPYVTWVNNNVNNGFTNLVKSIVDLQVPEATQGLTLTKKSGYNGYDLRYVYKTPENYYNLKLLVRNVLISDLWQSFNTEEEVTDNTIELDSNNSSIIKYEKKDIPFKGKNIAKLEVVKESGKGDINTSIKYDNAYTVSLPHNGKKVYPDLNGTITFDCLNTNPGDYVYKIKYLDCEDTDLGYSTVNILVKRPLAEIDTDFETTKSNMDVEKEYLIEVTCNNVYEARLKDLNGINFDAEILDIQHSTDLLETGTYEDYSFKIKVTPTKVGISSLTLVLADDQNDVTKEYTKIIDVYTIKHTPIRPVSADFDLYKGLNPKFSYSKKYKHNVPLAFVNKGDVADYILVAKYPVPQTDDIGTNYSKSLQNRLQLIKENKLEGADIGQEGGEYYKIINKDFDSKIITKLTDNNVLNGKAVPVVNSSFIDHMLANLTDVAYYGIIENNKDDIEANHFATFKGLNPNKDGFTTYPDNVLTIDNTNGGTYIIKNNNRSISKYYGVEDHSLSETLDDKNYPLLPIISNESNLTHNGQSNGIVDPFNMGVKIYHDTKVEFDPASGFKLKILDPYESTQSNTNERVYKDIEFNPDQFMVSVSKSYIEPNDYPINIKSKVYSGVEYWKQKNIALMDNVGLPYDNMIIEYEDDDSFKGNKGFKDASKTFRYGNSLWCNDLNKIKDLNVKTDLYYVSGGTYDKSLVKIWDDTNSNPNHILNRYPEYSKDMDIGYRSRLLLDSNVCYNVNKNEGYKNDHIFYNYRVAFLVFDKGIKDKVKLNISTQWLLMEKNKTYPFVIETDGKLELPTDPNFILDLQSNTITASEISEGSFIIKASKEGKDDNYIIVEYKIIEQLPLTKLEITPTSLEGFETQTVSFTVDTEDTDLIIESDNPTIYTMNITSPTSPYTYMVTLLRKGEARITFRAKVEGKSENVKHLNLNIKAKSTTQYSLDPKEVTFKPDEVIASYTSDILMENVTVKHNLTSQYEIGLWSTDLKNKRFAIDNNFKFKIDMGTPANGTYVVNYIAQSGAVFEQSDILTGEEPVSRITDNPNNVIRGIFTINIDDGVGNDANNDNTDGNDGSNGDSEPTDPLT